MLLNMGEWVRDRSINSYLLISYTVKSIFERILKHKFSVKGYSNYIYLRLRFGLAIAINTYVR